MSVGYGAAGGGDISTRLLAKAMEKNLNVPIVVLNKAGAQATLNPMQLARAKPDGYSVGALTFAPMTIVPHMIPVSYTAKDFIFLGTFGRFQYELAVRADSPYQTVQDLVNAAKVKSIFFGAAGAPNNIGMFELGRKSGGRFDQVIYKSGSEAVMALMSGQVEGQSSHHRKSCRMYAPTSSASWRRSAPRAFRNGPDVPTVQESGYDVAIESWMGLAVPKGTPQAIVDRLQASLLAAMKEKELTDGLTQMGIDPIHRTGPEYAKMIDESYISMGKALKDAGLAGKGQ